VQNGTARLLTGTGKESRIYPVLAYLHWLPVEVLTMVFKSLHGLAPEYIACLIQIQQHISLKIDASCFCIFNIMQRHLSNFNCASSVQIYFGASEVHVSPVANIGPKEKDREKSSLCHINCSIQFIQYYCKL